MVELIGGSDGPALTLARQCLAAGKPFVTANKAMLAHHGLELADAAEKAGMVRAVFSNVAAKYDLMNDAMSLGIHRLWKDAMMDWLAPRPGMRALDVAGGTGDIAFRFLQRAPGARVTVCDMTESMLIEGRKRAEAAQPGSYRPLPAKALYLDPRGHWLYALNGRAQADVFDLRDGSLNGHYKLLDAADDEAAASRWGPCPRPRRHHA